MRNSEPLIGSGEPGTHLGQPTDSQNQSNEFSQCNRKRKCICEHACVRKNALSMFPHFETLEQVIRTYIGRFQPKMAKIAPD